jgi:glutamate synthase (ferredoxin)
MIMVPEAYQNQPELEQYPEITNFYEYYSGLQEPWEWASPGGVQRR